MMRRLNRLLGRNALLMRSRGPADADQAGDLSDLESGAAVQQEMAEQARRVVIHANPLAEAKRSLQDCGLLDRQTICGNIGMGEPLIERAIPDRHSHTSLQLQVV